MGNLTMLVDMDRDRMERTEWASMKACQRMFGLHPERIRQLCADCVVRSRKMGNARQSQRLYNCDDIRAWLNGATKELPANP